VRDEARTMHPASRASAPLNRGIAPERAQNWYKKFFWIPSLNPPAIDPIARGIARITRQPIRIRIELRDADDDQSEQEFAPKAPYDDHPPTILPCARRRSPPRARLPAMTMRKRRSVPIAIRSVALRGCG
jgi:hypothetical protein